MFYIPDMATKSKILNKENLIEFSILNFSYHKTIICAVPIDRFMVIINTYRKSWSGIYNSFYLE